MPEKNATFTLERAFSEEEIEALRRGNIPQEMEDKWFWFMEGDTLYAHRSWTGICIYIIKFSFRDNCHMAKMNPEKVKQRGNQLTPKPGWESMKDEIMAEILQLKFRQNPELRERLLATGDRRLINGGKGKKDIYWGLNTITWEGENRLGELLMKVRDGNKYEKTTEASKI